MLAQRLRGAVAAAGLVLAAVASAQTAPPLRVNVFTGAITIDCPADQLSFELSSPAWLTWRCTSTNVRYRCRLTSTAAYGVGIGFVVANCAAAVILPPEEIFKSGYEP